jgi:cellulose synthase/poly-beta-1,6-N-acetylglucosamine synthase-like glycosyltransferase
MGIGRNLAYKKEVFFKFGGFSDQMNECAGDDDLFVNKVATRVNTTVVNTRESITWSIPKRSWRDWWLQKRRHVSVSPSYHSATKRHLIHEPIMRGAFYGVAIALFILGEPLTMSLSFGLLVLRLIMQLIILNKGAKHVGQPVIGLELVCFDIFLPLLTAAAMIGRKKRTW